MYKLLRSSDLPHVVKEMGLSDRTVCTFAWSGAWVFDVVVVVGGRPMGHRYGICVADWTAHWQYLAKKGLNLSQHRVCCPAGL